jgi:cell division protein FtsZ
MQFDLVENTALGTIIKVVGVGGAGGNAIQHMINKGVSGVEFIVANTDAQALAHSAACNVIQIGDTGLGAGMRPEVGRQLAEESRARIEDALRGAHMVFIAAGMGGGTGTGASPIVAEVAKSLGALTVAVVSKPFSYEGRRTLDVANKGIEELEAHVDSLIVILNEKLEEIHEDATMKEWFQYADDILNNAVAGIAEIINVRGHINVDFNDVKTVMSVPGKAMMGTAIATGIDRARIAAEQAVASPLLDGVDLSGARGVLVNITASENFKGRETKQVMDTVSAFVGPDAIIVRGIAIDNEMADTVRVTVVATGLGRGKPQLELVPTMRTGTNNSLVHAHVPVRGGLDRQRPLPGTFNYDEPSVWRQGAAVETVRALEKGGMETYDIPSFLRKQAD